MNELLTVPINKSPFEGLVHERDLIAFDGPLLSLFRDPNGEAFLYYWCDCGEVANRWMVLRVAESTLVRLINRAIPLDAVIPFGSSDGRIAFLDIAGDGSTQAYSASPSAIPESYRPSPGTFLEDSEEPEGPATRALIGSPNPPIGLESA